MTEQRRPSQLDQDPVDLVIERIDSVLPLIHQQAEDSKRTGKSKTPSDAFSPAKIKKTREQFEEMSVDSLLTRSGEDIKLSEETLARHPPGRRLHFKRAR